MTKIKRNDSGIVIPYTLPEEYRNLDGAAVEFLLENKRSSALVAKGEAVVVDQAAGHLAYTLEEGETLGAGIHIGEFQVTYADGTFISFPRSGYLEVDIQRNIDGGRALESEERIAVKVSLIDEKFDVMAAENAVFKGEVGAQITAIEDETAEWRESVADDVLADVYEQVDVDRVSNTEVREARGGEATLGAKIAKVDSQLAQTAKKDEVFTMANMGQDIKESMTGGSVPVVGRNSILSENIVDKQVTPEKTTFLINENDNLFNGLFINNYYITNNPSGGVSLSRSVGNYSRYNLIAIDVDPNSDYSVVRELMSGLDNGYYWFKVGTFTLTVSEILALGTGTSANGSVALNYASTTTDKTFETFKTGPNDKSLWVMVSCFEKPYVEIRKGEHEKLAFSNYSPIYKLVNVDAFSTGETKDLVATEVKTATDKVDKVRVVKEDPYNFLVLYPGPSGNYLGYRYGIYNTASINAFVWRLKEVRVYSKSLRILHTLTPSGADIEGVLKIEGEGDYIGSVHGDEQLTEVHMYLDGKEFNVNNGVDGFYNQVEFLVASDIYHENTTDIAFKKTKSTTFDTSGVHIKNRWKALADTQLVHVRGCLLSIEKMSGDVKLINTYRDSVVDVMPKNVPAPSQQVRELSADKDMVDFSLDGDFITAKLWVGKRGGSNNDAQVVDFGSRIKPYVDSYKGETVLKDQVVYQESNFFIQTT